MNRPKRYLRLRLKVALTIVVGVLSLPYLVDIAYMDDLTPTHSAQEIVIDKDKDFDDEVVVASADWQHNRPFLLLDSADGPLEGLQRPSFSQDRDDVDRAVEPFEYLITASLISRPPPIA